MKWYPVDETAACVRMNNAKFPFEEFSCLYPTIGMTYFPFEVGYDPVPVRDYMVNNPWIPVTACVCYGVFIVAGKAYFENRPAWDWRKTMAAWNLFLSVFSAAGFIRTAPHLLHLLRHYSWRQNLCMDPESHYGSGSTGLWVQMFILSKFPELLDTFFIVVHKKPLIFLHWYHHLSVLLYCWHSYVRKAPAGFFFCVMNYAVHAGMYFYYFLMAVKAKPKWLRAVYVTVAQISQMVVGVALTVAGCLVWFDPAFVEKENIDTPSNEESDEECSMKPENNVAALFMYGSYLFLFLQFFLQRYFGSSKKQQKQHKDSNTTTTAQSLQQRDHEKKNGSKTTTAATTNGTMTNGTHSKKSN